MEFGLVSIVLLAMSAVFILVALKLLIAKEYFLHFLRGFAGFWLLVFAIFFIMISLNLSTYTQLEPEQTLASVSFKEIGSQNYEIAVVNVASGKETKIEMSGDTFNFESRMLEVFISGTPYYMPNDINTRFYSLEQERTRPDRFVDLSEPNVGMNLWETFTDSNMGLVKVSRDQTSYMPMADGAVYSVVVTESGIKMKPVNDAAISISEEWL